MSGKTLLKLYAIIFSIIFAGQKSFSSEYDFVAKTIIEPYVISGGPSNNISHSLFATIEQNWKSKNKNHKLLGQLNFQNISYTLKDVKYQHNEIFPGEFYYEWSYANHRLTLGYQYLRLIDGFDTVGMESLNPEDQNESLFAKNFIRYRSVPAMNYKMIFNAFTVQLFNVFQPKANIINDYLLNQFKTSVGYTLNEDDDAQKFSKRSDTGIRFLGSADWGDWSLYGMRIYEKQPLYQLNISTSSLTKTQAPYNSYGGNLTFDFNNKIIRFDVKYNDQRSFLTKSFDIEKGNEILMNLDFEPPEFFGIQWAFNYSISEVTKDIDFLLRKKKLQDFYIQLSKKINDSLSLNSLFIQRISDSGSAAQFEIENNMSKTMDIRFGAEYFHKKDNTDFGQLSNLSRVYLGFNAYTSN